MSFTVPDKSFNIPNDIVFLPPALDAQMQTVWSHLHAVFLNYCGTVANLSFSHSVQLYNDTTPVSKAAFLLLLLCPGSHMSNLVQK